MSVPPAVSEAAFQLVVDMAWRIEAPWAATDPHAAELYIASQTTKKLTPAIAREFEASARALFALTFGRWPDTFAEVATYMDAHLP